MSNIWQQNVDFIGLEWILCSHYFADDNANNITQTESLKTLVSQLYSHLWAHTHAHTQIYMRTNTHVIISYIIYALLSCACVCVCVLRTYSYMFGTHTNIRRFNRVLCTHSLYAYEVYLKSCRPTFPLYPPDKRYGLYKHICKRNDTTIRVAI